MSTASWHSRFAKAAAMTGRRRRLIAPLVAAFALTATGCMGERTKNMAETCQALLQQDDVHARTFIQDADKQLAALGKPRNRVSAFLLELQDPDAMTHKAVLEQCLWLLKSRQD